MKIPKTIALSSTAVIACMLAAAPVLLRAESDNDNDKKKKPSINVRANPQAGFSPLRVVVSAELKGGANDYQDFYCPSIEWTWGDDTRTETSADCEPFVPGKSEIQRRYIVSRTFQTFGDYRVEFRLKQKDKVVGFGSTTVQVKPGVRDGAGVCCD